MFRSLNNIFGAPERSSTKSLGSGTRALATRSPSPSFQLIDPSEGAYKSATDLFSRRALEFITSSGENLSSPYSEQQLLAGYLSSVYMFAALRRVSHLISRVKIVAEVRDGDRFVRLPETEELNKIFDKEGGETLSRMWLNLAVYGHTLVYKVPSRRAQLQARSGQPIYRYDEGAVAGLMVLDKPMWSVDENTMYREVQGAFVNQEGISIELDEHSRHYLEREQFIYYADWNPEDPNRGRSLVAVAIHEAVANASIAQWMAEYFTRGAMPFIMVSLEEDPALLTDADLRKYKRQFEEYWQGLGSSLRSVFFDRKVAVEQVGINAGDIAAPELNDTALEGISATIGLDKELIVTPSGGSQERHALLIKRAWDDTVIPLAQKFIQAIQKDLGLPSNVRLVMDLSHITELEADRDEKSSTEISIYESGLQDWNEARVRMKMAPVEQLDGWYYYEGRPRPLQQIIAESDLPSESVRQYAAELWDSNLAKKSEVLTLLGRELPDGELDGYRFDLEEKYNFIQGLWNDDLLRRSDVLRLLNFPQKLSEEDDGYRSELERGADYGDWITSLWADNLLTRAQVLELLDMGLTLPENAPDGYADEIGDRKSNIMDMWDSNLMTRREAMERLGSPVEDDMVNGFVGEIEIKLDRMARAHQDYIDNVSNWWGDNLLRRSDAQKMLELPVIDERDGFQREVDRKLDEDERIKDNVLELWGDNLLRRSDVLNRLGIEFPHDEVDGYQQEVDIIAEAIAEERAQMLTGAEGEDSGSTFRTLDRSMFSLGQPDTVDSAADWEALASGYLPKHPRPAYTSGRVTPEGLTPRQQPRSHEVPYDYDHLKEEDEPYGGAEEDWLEDYGDTPWSPLEGYYNERIDILPSQVLPTDNPDWYEYDDTEFERELSKPAFDYDYTPSRPYVSLDDIIGLDRLMQIHEEVENELVPTGKPEEVLDVGNMQDPMIIDGRVDNMDVEEVSTYTILEPVDINSRIIDSDLANQVENEKQNLYVTMWFGANPKLQDAQQFVRDRIGENSVDYQSEDTFHITLVFAQDADEERTALALSLLPETVRRFNVSTSGISIFDNEDASVIKLDVNTDDALVNLQQKLAASFMSQGIRLSPYSDPGSYNPHITLAYAPPGTQIEENLELILTPQTIYIGRDDYDMHSEIILVDDEGGGGDNNGGDNAPTPPKNTLDTGYWSSGQDILTTDDIMEGRSPQTIDSHYDNEPDGTVTDYLSERELEDIEYGMQEILRRSQSSMLNAWHNGEKYFGERLTTENLWPQVVAAFSSAVRTDVIPVNISDNLLKSVDEAILNGDLDDEDSEFIYKAKQEDDLSEMFAWRKATLKNGVRKGLRFETFHVKEPVVAYIKEQLEAMGEEGDRQKIANIFDKQIEVMKNA